MKIKTTINDCIDTPNTSLSRRQLIKTGFFGSIALSTIHLSACSSHALKSPFNSNKQSPYQFLTKDDAIMLSAILPAMIANNWPTKLSEQHRAEASALQRIDLFLSRLGHYNLSEVRKLFDLLQLSIARGLATGVWANWQTANIDDVERFLNKWKFSSLSLFNSGYNALSDILCFAWYSNPENTQYAGYQGPPTQVLQALPQFHQKTATL